MTTKIQVRRDTSSNWTNTNPILSLGEVGFETDTGKFKIGNGSSLWSALDYFLDSSDLGSTYLTQSSASSAYLTQSSASSTYLTQSSASANYQIKDADLTAISELAGTLGILKKTSENTWSLITDNSTNWDTAYTDRNKWDGGATGLTASTGRTSLGLGTMATAATTDYAALAGATFTGRIIPRTGSASASTAPIDFAAGTLLTVPEDGALEYTSDGLYITSNPGTTTTGTGRGLIRAPQIVYLLANSTSASTSTPVNVFAAANDVLSVIEPAKLYRFSGKYYFTSTFTSGTANIQLLFAFSNLPPTIKYNYKTMNQTVATTSIAMVGTSSATTNTQVSPAVSATISYVVEFNGHFVSHATTASTFTPQFQMSTTGSSTVASAGSYIEVEKLGTSTQTLIAGNWA